MSVIAFHFIASFIDVQENDLSSLCRFISSYFSISESLLTVPFIESVSLGRLIDTPQIEEYRSLCLSFQNLSDVKNPNSSLFGRDHLMIDFIFTENCYYRIQTFNLKLSKHSSLMEYSIIK